MKFAVFFCDCLHFKIKIIYTLLLHSIRICYRNKYSCIHLLVKGLILHGINQLYVMCGCRGKMDKEHVGQFLIFYYT